MREPPFPPFSMTAKRNPAQRAAGRALKCFVVATNASENTAAPVDFQAIDGVAADVVEHLRVARLRRQFGLDSGLATVLARIAFETTEVR